jgi:zinc transport system substrate-binding protein
MHQRLLALVVVGLLATLPGCRPAIPGLGNGKPVVAVTMIPHAWLVRQIGGEHVEVITLVQPGESHETYQPSDAQVSQLMQADAYFRVGVAAEQGPWFQSLRDSKKLKIIDLRRNVPMLEMTEPHHHDHDHAHDDHDHAHHDHDHGHAHAPADKAYEGKDPHIWLSPRLLKIQAKTVAQTLAKLDRAHQAYYQAGLQSLEKRLDDTDAMIRTTLKPVEGKAFFVYHPAWGYFAHDYGLRQIALEQEGKEPSDQELTKVQQQAKQEGAKVIFVQPQISSQSAEAVAQAIGGRVQQIDPLEENIPANLVEAAKAIAESYR